MYNDSGPGSSVDIATDYGLDGPGTESRCGEIFRPFQTSPGVHPASCTMGTGSFPGVKYGRGVLLTTHPLLVPLSWKSRAIPLPNLTATTGPVTGTLPLFVVWTQQMRYLCCGCKALHKRRTQQSHVSSNYIWIWKNLTSHFCGVKSM